MKLEFWPVSLIRVYVLTTKLSLMTHLSHFGKSILSLTYFSFSIVMEFADQGDLFQKI